MIKFRRLYTFITCAAAAAFVAGCAATQPQTNKTDMQRERINNLQRERIKQPEQLKIYYDVTAGKAGHHFVSQSRGNCAAGWISNYPVIIGGELPPGLKMDGHNIVGTPQQPGNWLVKLRFTSIRCQDRSYPDEDVSVYFTIQGDAPRKLK
ncbi:MAG: hypothetical protein C4581_12920 [Nitrospiraceae bacterium]|nr:MAG: hypothetical protein C4581_12920 [Nitrospiraceae bacterium]